MVYDIWRTNLVSQIVEQEIVFFEEYVVIYPERKIASILSSFALSILHNFL